MQIMFDTSVFLNNWTLMVNRKQTERLLLGIGAAIYDLSHDIYRQKINLGIYDDFPKYIKDMHGGKVRIIPKWKYVNRVFKWLEDKNFLNVIFSEKQLKSFFFKFKVKCFIRDYFPHMADFSVSYDIINRIDKHSKFIKFSSIESNSYFTDKNNPAYHLFDWMSSMADNIICNIY